VLFVVLAAVLIAALSVPMALVFPELGEETAEERIPRPGAGIPAYLVFNLAVLAASGAMLRWMDRRSFYTLGLWFYPGWSQESLLGIGCGLGLITITTGIAAGSGAFRYTGIGAGGSLLDWLGIAGLILVAAALEEFLCRGYAFQRLRESLGTLWAVLITSSVFGLLHITNPNNPGPLSTANTILAGVLLAVAYLKTRGLWMPIALHWSWNFFLGPVFSSNVSGIVLEPRLFRSEAGAPQWLSGGSYGFEASAALTLACTAAIIWLWKTPAVQTTPAMLAVSKETESA
jgi:hypothetical protein